MKKSLFKVSLIAAFVLFTRFGQCDTPPPLLGKSFYFSWSQMDHSSKNDKSYSHYLALETDENLKAYHLGLKALFPKYQIPTAEELLHSIRFHPTFCGVLTKADGVDLYKQKEVPFLIFEELDSDRNSHFYVAYDRKLRHFTVKSIKTRGEKFAALDNAGALRYPHLDQFLQSTFSDDLLA